jgi:transposase
MARHHDASKERRWLDLILLWQKSKFTIREFCQRRQLRESSFYFWQRVLRQRGLIQDRTAESPAPKPAKAPAKQPAFVKLTLEADAAPATPTATAIEVVLSARRLLRVRPGFDPAMLLQLVRLLEEQAC